MGVQLLGSVVPGCDGVGVTKLLQDSGRVAVGSPCCCPLSQCPTGATPGASVCLLQPPGPAGQLLLSPPCRPRNWGCPGGPLLGRPPGRRCQGRAGSWPSRPGWLLPSRAASPPGLRGLQGPGQKPPVRGPAKRGRRRSMVAGNATPTLQVRGPRSPHPGASAHRAAPWGRQRPLLAGRRPASWRNRTGTGWLRSPVPRGHSRAGASPTPASPAVAASAWWLLGCGRSGESWEGHSGGSSSRQSAGHEGRARWVLCRGGRRRGHALPQPWWRQDGSSALWPPRLPPARHRAAALGWTSLDKPSEECPCSWPRDSEEGPARTPSQGHSVACRLGTASTRLRQSPRAFIKFQLCRRRLLGPENHVSTRNRCFLFCHRVPTPCTRRRDTEVGLVSRTLPRGRSWARVLGSLRPRLWDGLPEVEPRVRRRKDPKDPPITRGQGHPGPVRETRLPRPLCPGPPL
ncbi:tyrosine-protein phosphatase non-receptor type 1 isoform X7 [Ictidomys tridecemlineatus]